MKNFLKEHKTIVAGVFLLIFAATLIIFAVVSFLNKETQIPTENNTTTTQQSILKEGADQEVSSTDAKKVMNFSVEVDNDLKKYIPDFEVFKSSFEDYLIDEGFWGDVTKATCDNIATIDFSNNSLVMTFILNDPAKTKINAVYSDGKKDLTFNMV